MQYREFEYEKDQRGRWYIVFPAGFKAYPPVDNEDDVKRAIDHLEDEVKGKIK